MSKIALSGNASGTGVFTIASPNSSTDRTLTLPDNSGTVLTSASNLAGVTGVGKVLQVVNASTSTQTTSFAAATWVDTSLSLSITPANASNKILLICTAGGLVSNNNYVGIRIVRDSTTVAKHWSYHNRAEQWNGTFNFAINGVDSPAAATPVTYKIQIYSSSNTGNFYFNYSGLDSTQVAHFTAMEIAA
jgi:hypothetical protein